jgi:hypothetical protein
VVLPILFPAWRDSIQSLRDAYLMGECARYKRSPFIRKQMLYAHVDALVTYGMDRNE